MFDASDLDLLEALPLSLLGAGGDAYLKAHPEIPRDADGRPLRGMILPFSPEERADWQRQFNEPAPYSDYQGPSYNDLKKRDPSTYNDAERYWMAQTEGRVEAAQALRRQLDLALERDLARIDTRVAVAERDYERSRRELAETPDLPDLDPLGSLKKALPWVVGGVLVLAVGPPLVSAIVPVLAARRVLR